METKEKSRIADIMFIILLAGVVCMHLSRIRLGNVDIDEAFYLTVPYRLAQGEGLLADEWHVSQLVGFLLYPFVKCYLLIQGNTEGIYLASRYVYLVCLTGSAIVSYVLLRKRNRWMAAIANIMFALFTHACLRTLSYNTIGMLATWLMASVLMANFRLFRLQHFITGILLAIVVLCCPYMVLAYALYAIVCLWKRQKKETFGIEALGWVTAGSGFIALIFIVFVLSRTSLTTVLESIGYILADPAHKQKGIMAFMEPVLWFVNWFKLYFLAFLAGGVIAVFSRKYRRFMLICITLLNMLFLALLSVFKTGGVGKHAVALPLALIGLLSFIMTEKKDWDLFTKGWMLGMIYAFCMNLSSNQGIYVMCNASLISSCTALFMLHDFRKENLTEKILPWCFAGLILMQLAAQVYINMNYVYWEDDGEALNCEITEGPLKGVITTEAKKKLNDENYHLIQELGDLSGKHMLFYNMFPQGYLMAENANNASFSGWIKEYDLDNDKFKEYYKIYPEKIPDIIFVDSRETSGWDDKQWAQWCEENGYTSRLILDSERILFKQNE